MGRTVWRSALQTLGDLSLVVFVFLLAPISAQAQQGLLTSPIRLEPPLMLSSGKPLADKPYELESGKHYRLTIVGDGTAELAIGGADFFRNVWVNEIVINDIEVRPLGVDSIEFDDEGEVEMT